MKNNNKNKKGGENNFSQFNILQIYFPLVLEMITE